MLTRELAEDLVRKFPEECKIESDWWSFVETRTKIKVDSYPIQYVDTGWKDEEEERKHITEVYHFGDIVVHDYGYLENYSPLERYLLELVETGEGDTRKGELPVMCWFWNGHWYPKDVIDYNGDGYTYTPYKYITFDVDIKKIIRLGIIEDMISRGFEFDTGELRMDFEAVYKYFTGKDFNPKEEILVPRYDTDGGMSIDDFETEDSFDLVEQFLDMWERGEDYHKMLEK